MSPRPEHRDPRQAAEALLNQALAAALPRARFRHAIPVGPYVACFASKAAMLIVEVDDGDRGSDRDAVRTRFLNNQGYRLIRFWNRDVLRDVDAVLDAIACALPAELLDESGPICRIGPAAARAEWSPMPDVPVGRAAPAEPAR